MSIEIRFESTSCVATLVDQTKHDWILKFFPGGETIDGYFTDAEDAFAAALDELNLRTKNNGENI